MAGIFVIEGMTFTISQFNLRVDDGGAVSTDMKIALRYDACFAWAAIALEHRVQTIECLERRRAAWSGNADASLKGQTFEAEFRAAMQAIVAAAASLDALYDIVRPHAPLPAATREKWSARPPARHKQIAETLRVAFRIKPSESKSLRQSLLGMYHLRDAALHASGLAHPPEIHPELGVSTEWRLTSFRADVADMMVCCAVGILWDLSRGLKYRDEELTKYMTGLRARLQRALPDGCPKPMSSPVTFYLPPNRRNKNQETVP